MNFQYIALGLLIGLFVGVNVGTIVAAICRGAKRDEQCQHFEHESDAPCPHVWE